MKAKSLPIVLLLLTLSRICVADSVTLENASIIFNGEPPITIKVAKALKDESYFVAADLNRPHTFLLESGDSISLAPRNNTSNAVLAYFSSNDRLKWIRMIEGTADNHINDLDVNANGEIFLTGSFFAKADFDLGPAVHEMSVTSSSLQGSNAFILKLDSQGNFEWVKTYGNRTFLAAEESVKIRLNSLGHPTICGKFYYTVDFGNNLVESASGESLFILQTDDNGNTMWLRVLNSIPSSASPLPVVGTTFTAMEIDANDNLYFTGGIPTGSDIDPDKNNTVLTGGNANGFLLKLSSTGATQYTGQLGRNPWSIACNAAGDIAIGLTTRTSFSPRPVEVKIGNQSLAFSQFPTSSVSIDYTFVVRYTEANKRIELLTIPFNSHVSALQIAQNGLVKVAGVDTDKGTNFSGTSSGHKIFIYETDFNANHRLSKIGMGGELPLAYGNTPYATWKEVKLSFYDANKLLIVGREIGDFDFDPREESYILPSQNFANVFGAKYQFLNSKKCGLPQVVQDQVSNSDKVTGFVVWAFQQAFPGYETKVQGPPYQGGDLNGDGYFDSGDIVVLMMNRESLICDSLAMSSSAKMRYSENEAEVWMKTIRAGVQPSLQLMPNPTRGVVNISLDQEVTENSWLIVTDITGRVVIKEAFDTLVYPTTLNLSSQPAGIYSVSLFEQGKYISSKKLVLTDH